MMYIFGSYRLDVANASLTREKQAILLTPKAFNVLCYLLQHARQLVTKDDLWRAVWPGISVTDAALTMCVSEIRKALGDDAKMPRYIETVHRLGYRFIAAVSIEPAQIAHSTSAEHELASVSTPRPTALRCFGREAESALLHEWLERALQAERQIVFVTGEPGIGKTTLVEDFLRREHVARVQTLTVGRGQCIEHYGAGEPYLPLLDALTRLCRTEEAERFRQILKHHAPLWLMQIPAVVPSTDLEAIRHLFPGTTEERMLRQLAEAVEIATQHRGLILWLEDLHWSDRPTLDWLAFVARRREAARLLVIATYRPVDVIIRAHPLRTISQELRMHEHCHDLPLTLLTENAVAAYLAGRFGSQAPLPFERLAHAIHRRTEGNPLFMVNFVNDAVARGVITKQQEAWQLSASMDTLRGGIPINLRELVEQQFERLAPMEQQIVRVASVAGQTFSAALVAAALQTSVEAVEEYCAGLSRRGLLIRNIEPAAWPDGTVAEGYVFLHTIYQEVLYEGLPIGLRGRLHRHIGQRLERAHGDRSKEIAAELADHFERGREYEPAIKYFLHAAKNAGRRNAPHEAVALLRHGLELLKSLPDTDQRAERELQFQLTLGRILMATEGEAAIRVGQAYARARELCLQIGATPQLFPALGGLHTFYMARAELQTARELGEQIAVIARGEEDAALLQIAHMFVGQALFWQGDFVSAQKHLETGIRMHATHTNNHDIVRAKRALGMILTYSATTLWQLGYLDQAVVKSNQAISLAQELSDPIFHAAMLDLAAWFHQLRHDWRTVQAQTAEAILLSTDLGLPYWSAIATVLSGWASCEQGYAEEGISKMRSGLAAYHTTGAELVRSYILGLLAEAYGKAGHANQGLTTIAEALAVAQRTGDRNCEAELYRLKGQLALQNATEGRDPGFSSASAVPQTEAFREAETSFLKAIEIARSQNAKLPELRATVSLGRLWQRKSKCEAHDLLSNVYSWFTEGLDTKDLQEARMLLDDMRD